MAYTEYCTFVQDFITKDYQVSVKEVLDNALQGRETANFEFPLYTKEDQRRVDVLLNATTRRGVSGNVVGVLGVGQDITERKQVEMEKTRVAQELQTFIDTANAPIFGIDANGLVNEWNNKAAAITGFSREEVLGRNLVQVRADDPAYYLISFLIGLRLGHFVLNLSATVHGTAGRDVFVTFRWSEYVGGGWKLWRGKVAR